MMANTDLILNFLVDYLEERYKELEIDGRQYSLVSSGCYITSHIASEILKGCGYDCKPERVYLKIANKSAIDMVRETFYGIEPPENEYDPTVIRLGTRDEEKKYHYVVWFPNEEMVLDLTIGQATREAFGIVMKPHFSTEADLPTEIIYIEIIETDEYPQRTILVSKLWKPHFDGIIEEGIIRLKRKLERGSNNVKK